MNGDVGIRELKAHLSEVLDRVAAGEHVRVTDRGKPKAMIVPIGKVDFIERGVREGWITVGPDFGRPLPPATPAAPRPGMTTREILDDDRNG